MPLESLEGDLAVVDASVREWPEVRVKRVFGRHAWMRGKSMFGWVADEGVAVGKLAEGEVAELLDAGGTPARHGSRVVPRWYVVPPTVSVDDTIGWLRRAYEAVA